jgi:predicted MFS family arabinose efflux permease
MGRDEGIGFGGGADVPGAVLITGSLMLGVYTIVKPAAEQGWTDPQTLLLSAVSLGLLATFIWREATAKNPLIPLGLFRSRNVSGANVIQALSIAGMFATFFLGTLYLQRILGYDALEIGFAFLPATIAMGLMSARYSDRLVTRFGARTTLIPGLVLIMASLALFTRAPVGGTWVEHVLPVMILLGFGAGMAFPALMSLAMSDVEQSEAGLASGLVNTTAQVGAALGLAVLATLSSERSDGLIADGEATQQALTSGYHFAFWIGAALVLAAIVAALTILEPDAAGERDHAGPAEAPATRVEYSEAA